MVVSVVIVGLDPSSIGRAGIDKTGLLIDHDKFAMSRRDFQILVQGNALAIFKLFAPRSSQIGLLGFGNGQFKVLANMFPLENVNLQGKGRGGRCRNLGHRGRSSTPRSVWHWHWIGSFGESISCVGGCLCLKGWIRVVQSLKARFDRGSNRGFQLRKFGIGRHQRSKQGPLKGFFDRPIGSWF